MFDVKQKLSETCKKCGNGYLINSLSLDFKCTKMRDFSDGKMVSVFQCFLFLPGCRQSFIRPAVLWVGLLLGDSKPQLSGLVMSIQGGGAV